MNGGRGGVTFNIPLAAGVWIVQLFVIRLRHFTTELGSLAPLPGRSVKGARKRVPAEDAEEPLSPA